MAPRRGRISVSTTGTDLPPRDMMIALTRLPVSQFSLAEGIAIMFLSFMLVSNRDGKLVNSMDHL
jgi:hypothetical protein